jgi:hypothetical protein
VNGRPYRDLLLQNQFIFVENKENLVSAACETPQREQLVLRTPGWLFFFTEKICSTIILSIEPAKKTLIPA